MQEDWIMLRERAKHINHLYVGLTLPQQRTPCTIQANVAMLGCANVVFLHKVNISSNVTPMTETRRLTLSSQKAIFLSWVSLGKLMHLHGFHQL